MNTLKETGINLKYGDCHKYDRPGVKDYICCGAVIYNKNIYIYTQNLFLIPASGTELPKLLECLK